MTLNKVLVIGNVGNDPEMRYTPSGAAVTSFNVATNRRYTTSAGEQREETEWFSRERMEPSRRDVQSVRHQRA